MKTKFYLTDQVLKEKMFKKFVRYIPGYFDSAIYFELPHEQKELSFQMDYFEFHYRYYLSGMHQTLHGAMQGFRGMKSCENFDKEILFRILQIIENDVLELELYELMPRHIKAKTRLIKELIEL